jgi:hypothetical protein
VRTSLHERIRDMIVDTPPIGFRCVDASQPVKSGIEHVVATLQAVRTRRWRGVWHGRDFIIVGQLQVGRQCDPNPFHAAIKTDATPYGKESCGVPIQYLGDYRASTSPFPGAAFNVFFPVNKRVAHFLKTQTAAGAQVHEFARTHSELGFGFLTRQPVC